MLRRALLNIYSKDFHPVSDIEENLFNEIWKGINKATARGFRDAGHTYADDGFADAIRHSNAVFSAFKVHRAQNDMARLLLDSDGVLKPFSQWSKEVMPIASHQCRTWLKTEYDTAVIRAHQAADWRQFMREKDVLPNLRWMPSTSVTPGEDHRIFWNMVRPVDDPFWNRHRPGDRWNCKCSLSSTADPPTRIPGDSSAPASDPQPGLKGNPAVTRSVFSDDHPYFPSGCGSCPFYRKSFRNRLKSIFVDRAKDCYNCPYIDGCIDRATAKRSIDEKTFAKWESAVVDGVMPKLDKTPCQSVRSGILNRTNKVRNTFIRHCHHDYEVDAAVYIWNHPEELEFVRVSPLGEGKDMSTEKAQRNIKKKIYILGFVEFRIYEFEYRDKVFLVKTALCKKGHEQFYSLREK